MDTKAIKKRCEAATPEPWKFVAGESNNQPTPDDCLGSIVGDDWILAEIKNDTPQPEANAKFIAHARSDLPAALEALEEAQGKIGALRFEHVQPPNTHLGHGLAHARLAPHAPAGGRSRPRLRPRIAPCRKR